MDAEIVVPPAPVVVSVQGTTLYDPDPAHLWNRLHEVIFVRIDSKTGERFGEDGIDPLIWRNSKYPLVGGSHAKILAVLDEFAAKHGERLISDSRRRAALQRDLWFLFDWAEEKMQGEHAASARALAVRLAPLLRRLALTPVEIVSLKDNYVEATMEFPGDFEPANPTQPFLPKDLFTADGPWVSLRHDRRSGAMSSTPAPLHDEHFGFRSTFAVFISLPGGREATRAYLEKLKTFPNPVVWEKSPGAGAVPEPKLNPAVPDFPEGTRVALVRRALLISSDGGVKPTPLTLSVQLRVYRKISRATASPDAQAVFEFTLQRKAWFAGRSGGLHAVGPEEKDFLFVHFMGHGIDLIESPAAGDPRSRVMQSCLNCHFDSSVLTLQSYAQFGRIPAILLEDWSQAAPESVFIKKLTCREWGVLKGLWMATEEKK